MKPLAIRSSPMHQDDGLSIWDKFAGARSILGSVEAGSRRSDPMALSSQSLNRKDRTPPSMRKLLLMGRMWTK
jgi:hypothetical protein